MGEVREVAADEYVRVPGYCEVGTDDDPPCAVEWSSRPFLQQPAEGRRLHTRRPQHRPRFYLLSNAFAVEYGLIPLDPRDQGIEPYRYP